MPRRRRTDDSPIRQNNSRNGDEPEEMEPVPMWKTVAVIVVVAGCFIAVYPKMFHPMLMYALGVNKPQAKEPEQG